jgi:hypothetical protein
MATIDDIHLVKEMCHRVDLPWDLGRKILSLARVTLGVTADGSTDMVAVARAIKYASDNRDHLKQPVRSYSAKQNPFIHN